MGRDHGLLENTQESLRARATVAAELCSEVVECRYWDDEKNAWRGDNCRNPNPHPHPSLSPNVSLTLASALASLTGRP